MSTSFPDNKFIPLARNLPLPEKPGFLIQDLILLDENKVREKRECQRERQKEKNRKYSPKERMLQLESVQFSLAYDAVPIGIDLDIEKKKLLIPVAQTDR